MHFIVDNNFYPVNSHWEGFQGLGSISNDALGSLVYRNVGGHTGVELLDHRVRDVPFYKRMTNSLAE